MFRADRLAVPKLGSHDPERHAGHGQAAGMSVPQDVEADGGRDAGRFAGSLHGALLLALPPCTSIGAREDEGFACFSHAKLGEKSPPLIGQHDVARFAGLAPSHMQGAGFRIEVSNSEADQLSPSRDRGSR